MWELLWFAGFVGVVVVAYLAGIHRERERWIRRARALGPTVYDRGDS